MRYPAYPDYKESGVQWLGPVPGYWEVKRLKMAAHLNDKKIEADEDSPVPYIGMENIESWTGKLLPIDPDVVPSGVANRFTAKNTLFGKLRPYLAKACNPGFDGLCSTELLVIESKDFDQRALPYWLLTDGFIKLIDSSTYGSKMPRANWNFIGNCLLPVPPLPEQTAIANFLDRKTKRIDTLVTKKRRLIALLKEKRTALISRTVTRGLPESAAREFGLEPHTRFKDSGIEWLGQVPRHWEVRRLKMTAHLNDRKVEADEDNPVPYIGMENIESWTGKLLPIDPDVVPSGVANRFTAKNTLFGKLRPYLAKACNPGFDGLCSTELLVIESEGFDRRALLYWLLADGFIKLIDSSTYGSKMPRANWNFIGNCLLPAPPLPEQTAIATYLDRETAKIDKLVEKVEAAITRLQEYRTALITAAVTGKIDVREAVA